MENKPVKYSGRYQLRFRGTECLNCGHPLDISDKYCPNCAQANSTKNLTLRDFFDEFFSNVFSYDSKLFKTLGALVFRPGRITQDYVQGKRMSYTNPFRFLLSLAIIYFLFLNMSGDFSQLDRMGMKANISAVPEAPLNFNLNVDGEKQNQPLQALDSLGVFDEIMAAQRRKDSLVEANPKAAIESAEGGWTSRISDKADTFMDLIERDTLFSFAEAREKYALENSLENKLSYSIGQSLIRAARRPGAFLHSLISKLPFAMFFFLPVFSVFIWLVYIRKNYTYTDNLIFSFHNQSLLFILLILSFLIDQIFGTESSGIFLLVFGFYLYKAMRNFYRQGRFKTILKYMFLNVIFFTLAAVASMVLLLGSALTY